MSSRLGPVKSAPNNVSSLADPADKQHYIAPLRGTTVAAVRHAIEQMPRTQLAEEADGYARYVFTTALFRFKDDVEIEQSGDDVHIRSASRVGHSDLGTNRKRVEAIRAAVNGN